MNIKDYLHLYIGCLFIGKYKDFDEENRPLVLKASYLEDNRFEYIKPILRPLSDFKIEELIDFIHIGQPEIDAPYSEFEEALSQIRENGIGGFHYEDVPPSVVFKQVKFLLSKHFDLFGLIEAGLAIDKTKQQTTT